MKFGKRLVISIVKWIFVIFCHYDCSTYDLFSALFRYTMALGFEGNFSYQITYNSVKFPRYFDFQYFYYGFRKFLLSSLTNLCMSCLLRCFTSIYCQVSCSNDRNLPF
jgi:hypothetical protein